MNVPYAPPQDAQNELPAQAPTMQAQMAQALQPVPKPTTHDITIVTTRKHACAKVAGVPPEEVGIECAARSIAEANYFFHDIVDKTEGDLIYEGFDEEQIRTLPSYRGSTSTETLARDTVFEHDFSGGDLNRAARIVAITEHYIRLDYLGNGKPTLYLVITGQKDGKVLRKDNKDCVYPFDAIPFAASIPLPVPHRFIGRSLADKSMDIQRIKTALLRGALDNSYLHNAPRPVVSESGAGPNTIDDLLTVRQGAPIRVKGDPAAAIQWQVIPDITGSVFPMLQYMDSIREGRTGMSKQAQGLDANALQNQSATAVAQVFSESQMQLKLLARNIAEGFRDIFSLLHATIRKHGQEPQTVRLRNAWVPIDPRDWKTRDDMTIHVGLGTGSKAQQYAQIMGLANFQKELIMGGKGHLVPDAQLFNTATELVKLTGHKNPDRFFADPSAKDPKTGQLLNPPLPPAPDPKVQAVQAKIAGDQQASQQKGQLEQAKAQTDAMHQQMKAQADIEIAKVKADLDAKIAIIEAHVKMVADEQKMRHAHEQHSMKMQESTMGMVATAHTHDTKMEHGAATHEMKLEQMKNQPKPKGGK